MPSSALSNIDNTLPRLPNHDGAVICGKVVIPSGLARAGREPGHDNDPKSFMISDSNPVTVVYKSALRRFTNKAYISFPNTVSFGRATANEVEMYCMWDSNDTYFGVSVTTSSRVREWTVVADRCIRKGSDGPRSLRQAHRRAKSQQPGVLRGVSSAHSYSESS